MCSVCSDRRAGGGDASVSSSNNNNKKTVCFGNIKHKKNVVETIKKKQSVKQQLLLCLTINRSLPPFVHYMHAHPTTPLSLWKKRLPKLTLDRRMNLLSHKRFTQQVKLTHTICLAKDLCSFGALLACALLEVVVVGHACFGQNAFFFLWFAIF